MADTDPDMIPAILAQLEPGAGSVEGVAGEGNSKEAACNNEGADAEDAAVMAEEISQEQISVVASDEELEDEQGLPTCGFEIEVEIAQLLVQLGFSSKGVVRGTVDLLAFVETLAQLKTAYGFGDRFKFLSLSAVLLGYTRGTHGMRFLGQRIQEGYCAQGEEGDGDRTTSRRESVYDIFEGGRAHVREDPGGFPETLRRPCCPIMVSERSQSARPWAGIRWKDLRQTVLAANVFATGPPGGDISRHRLGAMSDSVDGRCCVDSALRPRLGGHEGGSRARRRCDEV